MSQTKPELTIYNVLDLPVPGRLIGEFLCVSDVLRLLRVSWVLHKGVIGRTVGILRQCIRLNGFSEGSPRLAAWLYACGQAPGLITDLSMPTLGDSPGIGGTSDRDVCRTFPDRALFAVPLEYLGAGGLASAQTWDSLGLQAGSVKLRRVLHMFSALRPQVSLDPHS